LWWFPIQLSVKMSCLLPKTDRLAFSLPTKFPDQYSHWYIAVSSIFSAISACAEGLWVPSNHCNEYANVCSQQQRPQQLPMTAVHITTAIPPCSWGWRGGGIWSAWMVNLLKQDRQTRTGFGDWCCRTQRLFEHVLQQTMPHFRQWCWTTQTADKIAVKSCSAGKNQQTAADSRHLEK